MIHFLASSAPSMPSQAPSDGGVDLRLVVSLASLLATLFFGWWTVLRARRSTERPSLYASRETSTEEGVIRVAVRNGGKGGVRDPQYLLVVNGAYTRGRKLNEGLFTDKVLWINIFVEAEGRPGGVLSGRFDGGLYSNDADCSEREVFRARLLRGWRTRHRPERLLGKWYALRLRDLRRVRSDSNMLVEGSAAPRE